VDKIPSPPKKRNNRADNLCRKSSTPNSPISKQAVESVEHTDRYYMDINLFGRVVLDCQVIDDAIEHEDIEVDLTKYVFKHPFRAMYEYQRGSNRTTKEIAADLERKAHTQSVKTDSIRARRKQFASERAILILKMIESGQEYVCSHSGCEEREFLTADHIYPLSKGGGDNVDNLQFMCGIHNSEKGDKIN